MSVCQAAERRRAISISVLLRIHLVSASPLCLVLRYLGCINRMLLMKRKRKRKRRRRKMRRKRKRRRQGQQFVPYLHIKIHGREGKLSEAYR